MSGDRRIAEKKAERKALEAREAEQSKQTTNWMRWIDQRIAAWFKNYFDGEDGEQYEGGHRYGHYTEALGQVIAEERRDRRKEVKTAIEAERQSVDAKLAALEQASNDRWAVIDQRIVQHIEHARELALRSTSELLGRFCAELREEFKLVLEEKERLFDAKLAALEERLKSVPGKLPVVKSSWQPESVTYQAEMVAHNGALYQARKDTAQAPGGSDWVCVARHGHDAITPVVRGNFNAHESYAQLDIVSFDGAAYIAMSNDPGLCPGEGWEPLSTRGQRGRRGESVRGPQGEKGAKGDKGDSAREIVSWSYDVDTYRAIPFAANGTPLPALDLRPFLERFLLETGPALLEQLR